MIQNKVVQSKLKAIARDLGNEKSDSEDLMQEMMIHLWKVEQDRPGMTESWYLQNCKFFARDLVCKGTSIDTRRRTEVMLISKDGPDQQKIVLSKPVEQYDFRSELIVKELIARIMGKLGEAQRRVFRALLTGMTLTEIGKKSTAHKAALETYQGKRKPDIIVKSNDILKLFYTK